ncbi:hypothetical protein R1sor_001260 [Riccia sorocarpa]|uniref:CCHC-type domain-containing protein n=1 Tax=Riccia sorocarpa TaxID=122646 RepID=A0ABD3GVH2_9MARC
MAETLGMVLFHSSHEANEAKYAHMRACIMREDTENLPNAVIIDLPWGGHYTQEVKYTRLPDSCFRCSQRGHRAADCPNAFQPTRKHGRQSNQSFGPNANVQRTLVNTPSRLRRVWKPKTPHPSGFEHGTRRELFDANQAGANNAGLSPRSLSNRFSPLASENQEEPEVPTQPLTQPLHASPKLRNQPEGSTGHTTGVSTQQATQRDIPNRSQKSLNLNSSPKTASSGVALSSAGDSDTQEAQSTQKLQDEDLSGRLIPYLGTPHLEPTTGEQPADTPSPLELMIVAKRRVLLNRQTSPHEEPVQQDSRMTQFTQPGLSAENRLPPAMALEDFNTPVLTQIQREVDAPLQHWNLIHDAWRDRQKENPENEGALVALQELKVRNKLKLETRLRATLPNMQIFIDYTTTGRGDAALLIPNHFQVSDWGCSGVGNVVWAEIQATDGPIKIASIHTPNTKEDRMLFWDRIDSILGQGRWILAGDYNMVELHDDNKGKSALLAGAEARAWKFFSEGRGMVDAYLCAVNKSGGIYTRQAFCGLRLDKA